MKRKRARSMAGFTLLEVVVALGILGVGTALTMSLISGSLKNIREVHHRERAVEYAESVLEIALLDDGTREPTTLQGDFPDGTLWTLEIADYGPQQDWLALPPSTLQAQFPFRLLSYAVDIISPAGQKEFQMHTLKLVSTRDVGNTPPRGR